MQSSTEVNNQLKMLLEKWVSSCYYFSGEIVVSLCMMSLCKLLIQKHENINGIMININKKESRAPVAILRTFVKYMAKIDSDKEEAKIGLYGDELELAAQYKGYSKN